MTAPSFNRSYPSWIALFISFQLAIGAIPNVFANDSNEGDDDGDGTGISIAPKSDSGSHDSQYSNLFDGSSQYYVPISLPPGRMGVTPSLALSYSSKGGNSWVGVGWNIGGGAIERFQAHHTAPKYDSSDIFNGGGIEFTSIGADEFRTRRESFSKITRSTGTNCWRVLSPEGSEQQYGCTADSRIGRNGIASPGYSDTHTWLLNRTTDTFGNQINYEYAKDAANGDSYLQYVRYTQGNGVDTGQYIQFFTESRPDVIKNYSKGTLIQEDQRLKEIRVYSASGVLFKKYLLEYRQGDAMQMESPVSKLIRVKEYGFDDSTPLISSGRGTYEFGYTERSKSFTMSTTSWLTPVSLSAGVRFGHVNSDAYPDFVFGIYGTGPASNAYGYIISDGNGSFAPWQPPNLSVSFLNYTAYSNSCDFPGYHHTFDSGGLFIDLNGDGLDDMIARTADSGDGSMNSPPYTRNNAYINAGNNTWTSSTPWLFPINYFVATQDRHPIYVMNCIQFNSYHYHYAFSQEQGVRTIDVNGDGLVDLVKAFPASPRTVYLNNGNGWSLDSSGRQSPIDFVEGSGSRKFDSGVRFADANGDGLVDILWGAHSDDGRTDRLRVYLNTGTTWVLEPSIVLPVTFVNMQMSNAKSLDTGATLVDINGDGIVDILTNTTTWIGTGSGWTNINFDPPNQFLWAATGMDTGVRVEDIDADGLSDILVAFNDTQTAFQPKTHLSDGPFPNLLKSITLPTGGKITFTYDSSAHLKDSNGTFLNSNLPLIKQVLTSIDVDDGRNLTTSHSVTDLTYSGGRFDSTSREFIGFQKAIVTSSYGTDSAGAPLRSQTITTFNQTEESTRGTASQIQVFDSQGREVENVVNTYQSDATPPFFSPLTQTDESFKTYSNGSKTVQKRSKYGYDMTYGNNTRVELNGDVSIDTDDRTVFHQFWPNTTNWIIHAPAISNELYSGVKPTDPGSGWKSRSEVIYQGNATAAQIPTSLRVSKSQSLGGSDGTRSWVDITQYDTFGNPTTTKDVLGGTTQIYYDAESSHPAGTYPTRVVNPLYQTSQTWYDNYQRPWKSRDPNGIESITTFDVFHRPTQVTTGPTLATTTYNNIGNPQAQFIRKEVKQDDTRTLFTEEYIDGLGRIYKGITKGVDSAHDKITATEFDNKGRPYRTYLPTYRQDYVEGGVNKGFVQTDYDALGRVTTITKPEGTFVTSEYDGWVTTITNEKGVKKDIEKDAYGNVIRVTEHVRVPGAGDTLYVTQYQYNVANLLTQIQDHLGNITSIDWDDLGRKTSMTDPDTGTWTYKYDLAGNLIEQVDGKGCWMKMQYDSLNRLVLKSDIVAGLPDGKTACDLVMYSRYYDTKPCLYSSTKTGFFNGLLQSMGLISSSSTTTSRALGSNRLPNPLPTPTPKPSQNCDAGKSIGKVVSESGPDYSRDYYYSGPDGIGRLSQEIIGIKGKLITNQYSYNTDGTLATATLEAGGTDETLLTYGYDDSGAIQTLTEGRSGVTTDILRGIDRNENGQPKEKRFGNDVITKMTYYDDTSDKDHRLKLLQTFARQVPGGPADKEIQHFDYEYDVRGNLKKITDIKPNATFTPPLTREIRIYDYDDLDRLIYGGAPGSATGYVYDAIGNLKQLLSNTNGYLPFGHAPTADPY